MSLFRSQVESAKQTDVPRLVEVWEAAVRETHTFLTEEDIQHFKPLVREQYLPMVELAVVRTTDGIVAGFAGVAKGKLEMLFIDPAFHRKGVGRQLLRHAIDVMGAREVDVNEQNPQAVVFYTRLGARIVGRSALDGLGKPFPLLHLRLPAEVR